MTGRDHEDVSRRISAIQDHVRRIRSDLLRRADLRIEHSVESLINSIEHQIQALARLLDEDDDPPSS